MESCWIVFISAASIIVTINNKIKRVKNHELEKYIEKIEKANFSLVLLLCPSICLQKHKNTYTISHTK